MSSLKEAEQADCTQCTQISSVADRAHDCKEVRKSIVEVFQERGRTDALKEAEVAESEAKRMLDLKHSENLCK